MRGRTEKIRATRPYTEIRLHMKFGSSVNSGFKKIPSESVDGCRRQMADDDKTPAYPKFNPASL